MNKKITLKNEKELENTKAATPVLVMSDKESLVNDVLEEDLISELKLLSKRLNKSVSNLVRVLEALELGDDRCLSRITKELDNFNSKLFDRNGK